MKLAAIDIGSNSVHMIIASVSEGRSFAVTDRVKEMVFLGRSVSEHGKLTPKAFEAGLEAITKFHKLAQRHRVNEIYAVATAAVREASNGGEFLYAVSERTGITPQVISGNEEAYFIYLAVRNAIDLSKSTALMFDIGGGSVETMLGNARGLMFGSSAKLGVQRLRSEFGPALITKRNRRDLETHIRRTAEPIIQSARARGYDFVVGTSGTILALAEASAKSRGQAPWASATGRVARLDELRELSERLATLTPAERVEQFGVDANRADSLHLGGLLLCTLLELAGATQITLCEAALREGIVLDYLQREADHIRTYDIVRDIRRHSVLELADRCGQHGPHPRHVAELALTLYDATASVHHLPSTARDLLEYGALLHDIGQHIGYERHEHHAAYIIRNGDLRGFETEEREIMALLARYHRKSRPRRTDPELAALPAIKRRLVRILSGILRLADGLDRSHHQLVRALHCELRPGVLAVHAQTEEDAELEIWGARRKCKLLERALGLTVMLEPVRALPGLKTA